MQSESSAVGSVLRSGRRGREFESPLSDKGGVSGGMTRPLFLPSLSRENGLFRVHVDVCVSESVNNLWIKIVNLRRDVDVFECEV